MKSLVIMTLLMSALQSTGETDAPLVTVFWNLENFFDWSDEGEGDSDREFSSYGSRHWTRKRFRAKCDAVAKALLWMGDRYGRMPDFIGLAEIENREVLVKLLNYTSLRKFGYRIIHKESSDRRGIDVAALYRESSMTFVSSSFITPKLDGVRMSTRDILHAQMLVSDTCRIDFIVNHHPSKYGGSDVSQARRVAAMTSLAGLCDSLGCIPKIVMGDFNDVPSAVQFDKLSGRLLNKSLTLDSQGLGTIRYKGKWELIDMFMVDESLDSLSTMNIVRIPFLMTYDRTFPGEKPLRTFSGPKYIGGVSDHCPIILKILLPLGGF